LAKSAIAASILAVLGVLLLPQNVHAAQAVNLLTCMTSHKEEMKALNTQIAELQRVKVAPGGPKTKLGECAHRLEAIRGGAQLVAIDKNTVDHREKISCLGVKKTLLEQQCACEAKGVQFSSDPAVVDNSIVAYKRFTDAQKSARKAAKNSPDVRKIVDEASRVRGCYSAQAIELLNKSSAALEKIARSGR
jgi:hypothetical protein